MKNHNSTNGGIKILIFSKKLKYKNMSKITKDFIVITGIIGVACTGIDKEYEKPNILLVTIDDLGWADVGINGADLHETPNIDMLARQGINFTNAYAASPVSSPTRASIQTGKYPARLHMTIWTEASKGQRSNPDFYPLVTERNLPQSETTIAEVLKQNGYVTIHIGKWHIGDAEHYPQTQGYEFVSACTPWGAPATHYYPYSGPWDSTIRYIDGFIFPNNIFGNHKGEFLADRMTEEAILMMKEVKKTGKPFFMNLCYYSVHTPIEADSEKVAYYRKKIYPGMKHCNPTYAAMVGNIDYNIGRLMRVLDELKITRSTVFIFLSDNGGYIHHYKGKPVTTNFPLRGGKGSMYEGGIRIPFIIRMPGTVPSGKSCEIPVSTVDIFPTLIDLCNIPYKNHKTDGISILPLIKNPAAELKRNALYWHYPHYYHEYTPVSAIRSGNMKLLRFLEDNRIELYNLKNDPYETINLAASDTETADSLNHMLSCWLKETKAQLPVKIKK